MKPFDFEAVVGAYVGGEIQTEAGRRHKAAWCGRAAATKAAPQGCAPASAEDFKRKARGPEAPGSKVIGS